MTKTQLKTPQEIITDLKDKFLLNITEWKTTDHTLVSKCFLLARAISETGQLLSDPTLAKHRSKCCTIFDEIFLDTVSAIYLATCAIENPAKIVMRRVLEMGISVLYLWDMPHIYYAWESQGEDLSFSEMLTYISSVGYKQYVSQETGNTSASEIVPLDKLKKHYGTLSDVVHGRITFFQSNLPDRFTFNDSRCKSFLEMVAEILTILYNAYCVRFNLKDRLVDKIPALTKI